MSSVPQTSPFAGTGAAPAEPPAPIKPQELGTQAFTNQAYGAFANTLVTVMSKAAKATAPYAIKYARSNDLKDRANFQALEKRQEVARRLADLLLEDPLLSEQTKKEITRLFPPANAEPQAGAESV